MAWRATQAGPAWSEPLQRVAPTHRRDQVLSLHLLDHGLLSLLKQVLPVGLDSARGGMEQHK